VTDNHLSPNFIRDEPGHFLVEVSTSASEEDMNMLTLDYHEGDDAVLLTVIRGEESISLDIAASDITALKETVDRCAKRLAAEQEAFRANADWKADCA